MHAYSRPAPCRLPCPRPAGECAKGAAVSVKGRRRRKLAAACATSRPGHGATTGRRAARAGSGTTRTHASRFATTTQTNAMQTPSSGLVVFWPVSVSYCHACLQSASAIGHVLCSHPCRCHAKSATYVRMRAAFGRAFPFPSKLRVREEEASYLLIRRTDPTHKYRHTHTYGNLLLRTAKVEERVELSSVLGIYRNDTTKSKFLKVDKNIILWISADSRSGQHVRT